MTDNDHEDRTVLALRKQIEALYLNIPVRGDGGFDSTGWSGYRRALDDVMKLLPKEGR